MPTGGFRFLQPDEIEALAPVGKLSDDAEDGYIYEVDLHYPQHLHDAHDDYPLAPESLEVGSDMYSPAQHAVFPQIASQRKLTPNLRDKIKYVVHYRNLKLYLQLGLVFTRIHRVLAFKQSTCLNTYIDFNKHQCSLAMSSFLCGLHMYNFHYNHMCVKYPRPVQLRLLFTDTGSLAYDVQTEYIYRDMAGDAATHYDFSEYPLDPAL